MQYSRLGNTGLIVSRLSFGAMTFGKGTGPFAAISNVEGDPASEMLHRSLDAGINFFDTANAYAEGESERILGKLLGTKRKDVVIATKVGFRTGKAMMDAGLSRANIMAACDASLQRLGTDYIDLYIVHREDRFTPIEETLDALNDLVKAGKVRYLGYSNWPAWKAALAIQIQKDNGLARFTSGQMHYSLTSRDVEHEVIPFMRHSGLSLTVWSPLAGGFLSGKYTRDTLKKSGYRLSSFDFLPFDKEKGFELIERLREIAVAHEASVAQIALAWLLAKPIVASVILGASKMAQLEDNLGAVQVRLSGEELSELDRWTAPQALYPNWFSDRTVDTVHKEALGI